MKGYLANGLFSVGDRIVNDWIANELRDRYMPSGKELDLFVPQEQDGINNKENYASSLDIFKADAEALMSSDFLICVIDGVEIDAGVACEIGMFATTGKPIFALYSDARQQGRTNARKIQSLVFDGTENQFMYRNLFVIGAIKNSGGAIYSDLTKLANGVLDFIIDKHNEEKGE